MSSILKVVKIQLGRDSSTENNFTLQVSSPPDGTLKIYRGNADSPLAEVLTIDAEGHLISSEGDMRPLGMGQTWQDVTSERALGVEYVNTTGRTITVLANTSDSASSTSSAIAVLVVDGVFLPGTRTTSGPPDGSSICAPVPPGSTYSMLVTSGDVLELWGELR